MARCHSSQDWLQARLLCLIKIDPGMIAVLIQRPCARGSCPHPHCLCSWASPAFMSCQIDMKTPKAFLGRKLHLERLDTNK